MRSKALPLVVIPVLLVLAAAIFLPQSRWAVASVAAIALAIVIAVWASGSDSGAGLVLALIVLLLAAGAGVKGCQDIRSSMPPPAPQQQEPPLFQAPPVGGEQAPAPAPQQIPTLVQPSAPVQPAPAQIAPEGCTIYVVQRGDNLYRIALRFGDTVQGIAQRNQLANENEISEGQELTICPSPGWEGGRG